MEKYHNEVMKMNNNRLLLHQKLVTLMDDHNVYFQPPNGITMKYPCIFYNLQRTKTDYADSIKYKNAMAYSVTLVDENPDSEYILKILELDYCSLDRTFTSDGLNHWVFTLYY